MARKPAAKAEQAQTAPLAETPAPVTPVEEINIKPLADLPVTPPDTTVTEKISETVTLKAPSEIAKEEAVGKPTVEGFLRSKYNLEPDQYPPRLKTILGQLETYNGHMSFAHHVTEEEGFKYQKLLLTAFRGALDNPNQTESLLCWDTILFVINQHRDTVYSDRLVCRFTTSLTEVDYQLFVSIVHLAVKTCSPRTRLKELATIDLRTLTERLRNQRMAQNILTYYSNQE